MAKAEVVNGVVEVNIKLNMQEAQALMDIVAKVGGDEKTTRRGLITNIYNALRSVGIEYKYPKDFEPNFNSIYFK